MKATCPRCGTIYEIEARLVRDAGGMARCFNCGKVFDVHAADLGNGTPESPASGGPAREGPLPPARDPDSGGSDLSGRGGEEQALPFEVPEDLPTLEASQRVALDLRDTLHPAAPRSAPWWQKALVLLLTLTLLAQLAWLRRDLWIHHPMALQLCAWLNCKQPQQVRPDLYRVVERDMQAIPGSRPPALRLHLRFRNDADFPQPLPRLQLSLLDSNGSLIARRLLRPREYLAASWAGPTVAAPHEVVTIELLLEDPGPNVRSFAFDFL